jgi:hypothetical protein
MKSTAPRIPRIPPTGRTHIPVSGHSFWLCLSPALRVAVGVAVGGLALLLVFVA